MTEVDWLQMGNATALLGALRGRASERKLRLIGCGACRRAWRLLEGTVGQQVVEVAERFVEGDVSPHLWAKVRRDASRTRIRSFEPHLLAARRATLDTTQQILLGVAGLFYHDLGLGEQIQRTGRYDQATYERYAAEWTALAALIRDIIGNPFRPVALAPEWRTGTSVALARTMYDAREFSAMPILADALQDAGCDSDDILTHCRDVTAVHVRGCWVVDLVLGKE